MDGRDRIAGFFLGNWHYGVAVLALTIEASLQQGLPLNDGAYLLAMSLATVVYYTHAYRGHRSAHEGDVRQRWYARNHVAIGVSQVVLSAASVLLLLWAWERCGALSWPLVGPVLLTVLVIGAVAVAYLLPGSGGLRRSGVWKPLAIAFVWAAVVTVLPATVQGACGEGFRAGPLLVMLFLKDLLFVMVLCILFDIKDQARDHRESLRTMVVQRGLRATLFRVVLPLSVLGMVVFVAFGVLNGAGPVRVALNMVPFVALLLVVRALRRRRSLLFYLVVVDGLLMLKGVCGSLAALLG